LAENNPKVKTFLKDKEHNLEKAHVTLATSEAMVLRL
jgi:hypothetical protein